MNRIYLTIICALALTLSLTAVAQVPAGTPAPAAEDHFASLYSGAAGKYAWSNWKGSFKKWQKQFRASLEETLGVAKIKKELKDFKPSAFRVDSEDVGYAFRERWEIWTEPDVLLPIVILRPKELAGPCGLVITPHGHSKNTELYAGVYWNEDDRSLAEDGERDIAVQAAKEGFIAIAPTARAFGKTRTKADLTADATSSCHDYMLQDLLVGRTPVGDRVWDIMKIIDWSLENLPVDPDKVIVSGHSGGGTATIYAGAIDTRIAICIPSGSFSSYEASIGSIRHCECNYIPGMLNLGNMGDLAGLVAGRNLCIIQGKTDGIFPIEGAREEFRKTEEIFRAAGKGRCALAEGDGGHRYYKEPAWKFIHACLGDR